MAKSGLRLRSWTKLSELEKLEIAKDLVLRRNLKGAAYTHKVTYQTVYRIFITYVDVIWRIRDKKPIQSDLFGPLSPYRD